MHNAHGYRQQPFNQSSDEQQQAQGNTCINTQQRSDQVKWMYTHLQVPKPDANPSCQ